MSDERRYWQKRAERLERELVEAQRNVDRLARQNDELCDQIFELQQKLKGAAA